MMGTLCSLEQILPENYISVATSNNAAPELISEINSP